LLQCQTASLEPDIHEPGAREVGVGENWSHLNRPSDFRGPSILPRHSIFGKYGFLHLEVLRHGIERDLQILNEGETTRLAC
jgi:hypothetical protein